ncbi:MAG: OmpA family protein [Bacteroidales bacterium]|nr:OmpA family protein [Bacteroidales bacterium]
MKRTVFKVFLLFFLTFSAYSQRSESEIALREYFTDAEFFLAQEFYPDALSDYLQVYKRGYQQNPNINYRIGICYLNIAGEKDKAIPYLLEAKKSASTAYRESSLNEKHAPLDVYLYLGNAYRVNNQLDKAIESYMTYKEILPEDEVNLHKYADQQIEACNIANEFMAAPQSVEITNLGSVINTSNDDYKGVISGDGSSLVYMHRLPFYDAVYFSKNSQGVWSEPQNITPELLSDGDQFVCALSYDGKTLLLTREDEFNSDILVSRFNEAENRWSVSAPLGASINTKYWESHASLSKDGKTIYFASNRRNGQGEMDLYYAELTAEGVYGPAQNIAELNTGLNEDTPFLTEDGEFLFFSSQSFTSMGGYDIFVSRREGNTWGLPVNLGYPINSTDDDLFYYPMNNGHSGLMSLILDDGLGGMDLNEISFTEIPQVLIITREKTEEIAGVSERDTEELLEEGVKELVDETTEMAVTETTKEEVGEVIAEETAAVEETDAPADEPVSEVLPVQEVRKIPLSPVLFGFDKASLTSEGKAELDKIAALLKTDPSVKVVLVGFTDPLGPENYNLSLSKNRAQATLEYLLSAGVDASRMKAVGKGETNFIAKNTDALGKDLPEGRRYNRRVEFEITGTDTTKVQVIRIDPVPEDLKIKN